jgi:hypothetical protein
MSGLSALSVTIAISSVPLFTAELVQHDDWPDDYAVHL